MSVEECGVGVCVGVGGVRGVCGECDVRVRCVGMCGQSITDLI